MACLVPCLVIKRKPFQCFKNVIRCFDKADHPDSLVCFGFLSPWISFMLLLCKMGWCIKFAQSELGQESHSEAHQGFSSYRTAIMKMWRCIWPSSRGHSICPKVYLNNNNGQTKIMRRKKKQNEKFHLNFPSIFVIFLFFFKFKGNSHALLSLLFPQGRVKAVTVWLEIYS